jgi:hypothetical protein
MSDKKVTITEDRYETEIKRGYQPQTSEQPNNPPSGGSGVKPPPRTSDNKSKEGSG